MEVQKTALYNTHKNLGAKFVSFAGYEMPVQYKEGIVKEHLSIREYAGFFDVSHMGQFFINGNEDLAEALEKIIPADLKDLKINHSKYSFLLNDKGGVIDDLIITKRKEGFSIILNAACKEKDIKQIAKYLNSSFKFTLEDRNSLIALQGPKAAEILEKNFPGVKKLKFMQGGEFTIKNYQVYITRSGYTGEDGFEISISNNEVESLINFFIEKKVKPAGLGARDTLRLEAGLCLYGNDLNENINPIEANLKWAISKRRRLEGGFKGYETIKKNIEEGAKKIRVGIKPQGKIIARGGVKIFSDDKKEIGFITSGTFGPSLQLPVSMGYINLKFSSEGTNIQIKVRDKFYGAKISKLPFYKKSYAK
jgi:aminomethyltransferase